MEKATIIGVDLAKHVFQVHGACGDGSVAFRKKIPGLSFSPFCRRSRGAWWLWRPVPVHMVGRAIFKRKGTRFA